MNYLLIQVLLFYINFRYLVLDHLAQERANIVVDYLSEIHKRGPPPPPTASDTGRRK